MQNHFELFQLPQQFNIDLSTLEANFRAIQNSSHPDRFVTASDAEKLAAMQTATNANEAYQTLKKPALRAAYLLGLQGIDVSNDRAVPTDFLVQQMEWREAVEDNASNLNALHDLLREVNQASTTMHQTLGNELDTQQNWSLAAETLRKLQFMDKLREEIDRKIDVLED